MIPQVMGFFAYLNSAGTQHGNLHPASDLFYSAGLHGNEKSGRGCFSTMVRAVGGLKRTDQIVFSEVGRQLLEESSL